jgi:hypothetical protein
MKPHLSLPKALPIDGAVKVASRLVTKPRIDPANKSKTSFASIPDILPFYLFVYDDALSNRGQQ